MSALTEYIFCPLDAVTRRFRLQSEADSYDIGNLHRAPSIELADSA